MAATITPTAASMMQPTAINAMRMPKKRQNVSLSCTYSTILQADIAENKENIKKSNIFIFIFHSKQIFIKITSNLFLMISYMFIFVKYKNMAKNLSFI